MPRKSRATGLGELAAAIGLGDTPAALALALAAWRETRCAELADLVDAIGARCRPAAIGGRGAAAFHKAWIQLAESRPSPVAVGALASSVGKNIPVVNTGRSYVDRDIRRFRAFLDRVAVLARLPHDPRIASGLVDVLERAPWSIESGRRIYQPAVDLVVAIADERSVSRLQAIVERPTSKHALVRAYFAEALPAAAQSIASSGAREARETREAAAALVASLAEPPAPARASADLDQLWAECLAHPDDDGPRGVLADALLERGDPRGEFMSLQLRAALDDNQRKRAGALLRAHEKDWLGDLATVTKQRVWRRGFLEEAELARNASADAATWERAAAQPELATVRRLVKGAANATHYQRFVTSKQMRALREVTALSIAMLDGLGDRMLETLEVDTPSLDRALEAAPGAIERTGAKRVVFATGLWPSALVQRLDKLRGRERLHELGARPNGHNATAWFEDPWPWLCAHASLGVAKLSLQFARHRLVTERHGKKVLLDVIPDEDHDWLDAVMESAPRTVELRTDRDRARRARRP